MTALKNLDDLLTYQDVNEILKFHASNNEPDGPFTGQVWLDLSTTPPVLRRFNGTNWKIVGMVSSDILSSLLDVDGTGSGLDADLLDGQEGTYYQKSAFWTDNSGETENIYIQTGQTTIPAAATTISFTQAYTSLKTVMASSYTNNASNATFIHLRNFTTTSFRATCFDNTGAIVPTTVAWVAVGRRD